MAFREIRRLAGAFDVEQIVEFCGRAFERDAIDGLGVQADDEKNFASYFKDESAHWLTEVVCGSESAKSRRAESRMRLKR